MSRSKRTTAQPLPVKTYIIISVAGFLVSLFCLYYYFHYLQGRVSEKESGKAFYIVLILFGIAASAMVFGAMNSYGALSGERMNTKFQFTGPVVGVILIVLGGFYLPQTASQQTLAITVVNEERQPLTAGKVVLYFLHHTREQAIDNRGMVVFSDINEEDIRQKVKLDVTSDGYTRLTLDTLLKGFGSLQLTLAQNRTVTVSGQLMDAEDRPIKDADVLVDGTRFYGRTASNGTYSFTLTDYAPGDEISLVTSHKDYKDKTRLLKITRQQMTDVDFVLQPLASSASPVTKKP